MTPMNKLPRDKRVQIISLLCEGMSLRAVTRTAGASINTVTKLLIDAQPYGGKKKGADGGIDGLIYFRSDAKTTERVVVSVKGGDSVSVPMVRDLKGVLDREKAPIGVFLTLAPPTRPMEAEAASAGFYTLGERQYPRIQIITIKQALAGAKPAIPLVDTGAAFRRAAREDSVSQVKLDL